MSVLEPDYESIDFYPNPVLNMLTLQLPEGFQGAEASIFDITGKLIVNKTLYLPQEKIDMSNFNSGMYFLNLQSNDSNHTYKLIKN